jgi:ABC-2 type transport system permease protein
LLISLAFLMLFLTTSGTLMQAVVEEKDSRTSEIMFTSVSTGQFMGGKVLGVVAMAATEVLAWSAIIGLVMFVAARIPGLEWVRYVRVHPRTVFTIIAYAIPAFVLYCALTAALGALVADAQESQQVSALFALPSAAPFYFAFYLIERPGSLVAIFLTLFPLTALTSLCLRATFTTVPTWQLLVGWALLVLSALGSVALAGRAFRLGMLRYGQRVAWRELFRPGQGASTAARPPAGGR